MSPNLAKQNNDSLPSFDQPFILLKRNILFKISFCDRIKKVSFIVNNQLFNMPFSKNLVNIGLADRKIIGL